jgi:hypothetical protein
MGDLVDGNKIGRERGHIDHILKLSILQVYYSFSIDLNRSVVPYQDGKVNS